VSIIVDSGSPTTTKVKPIAPEEDDWPMDATAAVVLQFDDGLELSKEVNDLTLVSSLGNDSTISCVSIFLTVNSVVPNTTNNTC
jgi:hypothetical protein